MANVINYNITADFESDNSGTNFMDVGIHENVELTRIVYNTTDKGNQFLAFYFKNETGAELSHTEWEPGDQDLEKLQSKTQNQMKRVHHIMTKFMTKEEAKIKVSSFKEFAEAVISKMANKYVGKKVRVKVIYSWNDFTSLPKYTPFIETMDIAKEDSKLKISSIDKMVKDKKDKETSTVVNIFDQVEDNTQGNPELASAEGKTNDLPF